MREIKPGEQNQRLIYTSPQWVDYELLDSGDGQKFERFGKYRFIRPEHQAIWKPASSRKEWSTVDGVFQATNDESGGKWKFNQPIEPEWEMRYKGLGFKARTSNSRHLGVFPEQATHWDWIQKKVSTSNKPMQVLNLFGYTGLASLAAAGSGAHVTHVDASKA
jgi:23S rRNA (cytosine1962-C5)-methyltransferase